VPAAVADPAALTAFIAVLGGTSAIAFSARWLRPSTDLPSLEGWALAGRGFGAVIMWFLLGGSIFTAYTFAAVPGLAYGAGALGFFALPYTIMLCPLLFVLLPRLARIARDHNYVTAADFVRDRYDSPLLALAVAVTGILATMPYIALQLLGIRAVLTASGIYARGLAGDLILVAVFAILAAATYRRGLRAPIVISFFKGALVLGAAIGVTAVALVKLGGPATIFDHAGAALAPRPNTALLLDPTLYSAFASLALGSALALPMYPHVLTASFAANSEDTLRRASVGLPAWTGMLGLFGFLGIAALAAGILAPDGGAEVAVPLLVANLLPSGLAGAVFGALAVGALVPAAVMSVAVATLFVRNIYTEFFFPTATPKHQLTVARWVSLITKVGALAFVLGLKDQDAINLQLLGGVWILQTLPAVALGAFNGWFHRAALLTGWAAGMTSGTLFVVAGGFASVREFGPDDHPVKLYAALVALAINLAVAAAVTTLVRRRDRDPDSDPNRDPNRDPGQAAPYQRPRSAPDLP
jgi:solute:Na+ symporter, SSS family